MKSDLIWLPDFLQLIIGNFGLSYEQSKTQMAMWAIFAAPLLMSVDLRTIKPDYKAILQNRQIIAVNQDRLGIQGRRIYKVSIFNTAVWESEKSDDQISLTTRLLAEAISNSETDLHHYQIDQIDLWNWLLAETAA